MMAVYSRTLSIVWDYAVAVSACAQNTSPKSHTAQVKAQGLARE